MFINTRRASSSYSSLSSPPSLSLSFSLFLSLSLSLSLFLSLSLSLSFSLSLSIYIYIHIYIYRLSSIRWIKHRLRVDTPVHRRIDTLLYPSKQLFMCCAWVSPDRVLQPQSSTTFFTSVPGSVERRVRCPTNSLLDGTELGVESTGRGVSLVTEHGTVAVRRALGRAPDGRDSRLLCQDGGARDDAAMLAHVLACTLYSL